MSLFGNLGRRLATRGAGGAGKKVADEVVDERLLAQFRDALAQSRGRQQSLKDEGYYDAQARENAEYDVRNWPEEHGVEERLDNFGDVVDDLTASNVESLPDGTLSDQMLQFEKTGGLELPDPNAIKGVSPYGTMSETELADAVERSYPDETTIGNVRTRLAQSRGRQQSFIDDETAKWDKAADGVDGTSIDDFYKSQLDWDDVHDPDRTLARQIDNAQKLELPDPNAIKGVSPYGTMSETELADAVERSYPDETTIGNVRTRQVVELGPEQELRGVEKLIHGVTPDAADVQEAADIVKHVFGGERYGFKYTTDDELYTPVEESLVTPDVRYRTPGGGTTTKYERGDGMPLPKNYDRSTFLSDPMGTRGPNRGRRAEIGIVLRKMQEDISQIPEVTPDDITNYLRVEFGDEYSGVQTEVMRQFLATPMGKYWKEHIGKPAKAARFDKQFGEGKSKGKHVSVSPKLRKEDKKKPHYKADRGPGSRGLDEAQEKFRKENADMIGFRRSLNEGRKPGDPF
jgi:hypothetical protein